MGWGKSSDPMAHDHQNLDLRRRRILWRATHRGIKEMDLILGGFATRRMASLDDNGLAMLEAIIALPDQDLLSWAMRQQEVPAEHASSLLLDMLDLCP
jgi:antitoxin CptB